MIRRLGKLEFGKEILQKYVLDRHDELPYMYIQIVEEAISLDTADLNNLSSIPSRHDLPAANYPLGCCHNLFIDEKLRIRHCRIVTPKHCRLFVVTEICRLQEQSF